MEKLIELDLTLFDGEGAGGGEAAPGAEAPAQLTPGSKARADRMRQTEAKYSPRQQAAEKQQDTAESQGDGEGGNPAKGQKNAAAEQPGMDQRELKRAEFEKLIKGDYKDLFAERTQKIIDDRFRQAKALEERQTKLSPMMDMLTQKYGVKPDDLEGLSKAIEEDASFYEDEAYKKGLSVEQLKEYKRLERENESFRKATEARQQQEHSERILSGWNQQAEQLKQVYPGFDFAGECNHPDTGREFVGLLRNNISVRRAYEVLHQDEILGGAMQYTAQQVQKKTVADIQARGMRPQENGTSGQGAAETKPDVHRLTREQRADLARRAARGERITFG